MLEIYDVPCPVCPLLCDDLTVEVRDDRATLAHGGCARRAAWFEQLDSRPPGEAWIGSQPAPIDSAIAAASDILAAGRAPLLFGFGRSTVDSVRAGVSLAEQLGATIAPLSACIGEAELLARQFGGFSTCTLGELRQRADLILFWNCDPLASHQNFLERFINPAGDILPHGRADRVLAAVGTRTGRTAAQCDLQISMEPGKDVETLWALRQLLRDEQAPLAGISREHRGELSELADRIHRSRYGVILHNLNSRDTPGMQLAAEAMTELAFDLNARRRFAVLRLGTDSDVATQVLCWQTGFPGPVNFARGFPRYTPGEFSAERMLDREEADCCVIVGSAAVDSLSDAARGRLSQIPTVVIDQPDGNCPFQPSVRLIAAAYGYSAAGTSLRLDHVPLRLKQLVPCSARTEADLLKQIAERLPRNIAP